MKAIMSYPPRRGSGPVKTPPSRFAVASAIDGFEVVDFDGRPVTQEPSEFTAIAIAETLNDAAKGGTRVLSRAIQAL